MNSHIFQGLLLLSLVSVPTDVPGQEQRTVTLQDAIATAAAAGPGVAGSHARSEAARQATRLAAAPLLPQLGVQLGALRSDDPVAAFGSRLRQGRFTQADFDPALLNDPDPLTDWHSALMLEWNPVDLSRYAAVDAAEATAEAAASGARWTARSAAFLAEARFIQALGAERLLEAATAALASADANLGVVGRRVTEGLLTEADLLRADAATQAATAGRIDAERAVADARGRLGLAMGWPATLTPVPFGDLEPTGTAPGSSPNASVAGLATRADLLASYQQLEAARAHAEQARRSRLPRLGGFARMESHSARALSNLERSWSVGVQVTVPLFTGFAATAGARAGASSEIAAREAHEDRLGAAQVEVAEAQRAETAAFHRALAAEAARDAANEAMRLVRLRFEEGLATTADLLAAQASAAEFSSGAVRARLGHRLATARLRYLTEIDPNESALRGGI
jgi:outer membrane protein TolC